MKNLIIVVIMLIILTEFVSCGESITETTKTLTPVKIAEWSGIGTKRTEPFTVNTDIWVVSWTFYPNEQANLLIVEICKPADPLYFDLPVNFANVEGTLSDSSYQYEKGTFYLDITSLGGAWSISIIEFK